MKSKSIQLIVILIFCSLIISPVAAQTGPSGLRGEGLEFEAETDVLAVGNPNAKVVGEEKGAAEPGVYIVQLADASLALYKGDVAGLAATSPAATGAAKLDVNTAASRAYRAYLAEARAEVLGVAAKTLGRTLSPIHVYDVAYNGFAVELSPAEAQALAKLPGVQQVMRDFTRYIQTDTTPEFLNAVNIWNGNNVKTGIGTMGEGMLVGIIDTGINMDHPSFADIGGDSYDHDWTPRRVDRANYVGWCATEDPDYDNTLVCNDKLVGVYSYPDSGNNPEDDHSHGSHTASTSAGNILLNVDYNGLIFPQISGMAPHANIISYDVCTPTGGCQGNSILAAIEDAVTDKVDVINYSIGGGASDPWNDPDSLAYLAAREAGVFVATSAGNSGPGESTVGSPGNSPWMTTVANMTIARVVAHPISVTGPGTVPTELTNLAGMPGSGPAFVGNVAAGIIYSGDVDGANITGCAAFPANSFDGAIALIQRGGCTFATKVGNADTAGAVAVIVFNNVPGPPIAMGGLETTTIPSAMLDLADGSAVRDWVQAETDPTGLIESSLDRILNPAWADIVAAGSSRGPNVNPDFIKPDIGAPGSNIFAAYAGDASAFGFMSGTSMASPHVAGAAALIRDIHPTWTPSMVESALMMTSETENLYDSDAVTPADPFDLGAGRLDLTNAALAGLALDEDQAGFLAADPNNGGDPTQLNLASLANNSCLSECSWTRTFTVVSNLPADYTITFEGDVPMTATPNVFKTNGTGDQPIEVTFTADVSALNAGEWYFGTVILTPVETGPNAENGVGPVTPELHLPVAVVPSSGVLPNLVEFETRRNAGSIMIEDLQAVEITDLKMEFFGLVQADLVSFELMEDPTNDDWGDDLDQIFYTLIIVPENAKRLVAEVTASEAPDADLYVFQNGVGVVCASTTASWQEYCSLDNPVAGAYFVIVQNWQGSANQPDAMTLATAVVTGDETNFTAYGPASVPALTPFDLQLRWDTPTMQAGDRWYGAFSLGTDAGSPGNIATIPVNIQRIADDVTKAANVEVALPGDTVTYTISVQPNVMSEDLAYMITDTIPTGMTYVTDSLTASKGTAQYANGEITWSLDMPVPNYDYNITTSANDPWCDTGFGGYVDLAGFGISTQSGISGDSSAWTVTGWNVNFYGVDNPVSLTDDGFIVFDVANNWVGGTPWVPQSIPDATKPNNLLAALWQDMEIFYDQAANTGVTLATASGGAIKIIEYDDIEYWGGSEESWDFEIVSWPLSDAPGAYEFIVAYDNLSEVTGPLTIGIENVDGTKAQALVNKGDATGVISNGFMVCYDYVQVGAAVETLTYAVQVDTEVPLGEVLTNAVQHQTDNPWSVEALTWDKVYIGNRLFWYPLMP